MARQWYAVRKVRRRAKSYDKIIARFEALDQSSLPQELSCLAPHAGRDALPGVSREVLGQSSLHSSQRVIYAGHQIDHRSPHGVAAVLGRQLLPVARLDRVEQVVRVLRAHGHRQAPLRCLNWLAPSPK